jgi:chitosanase
MTTTEPVEGSSSAQSQVTPDSDRRARARRLSPKSWAALILAVLIILGVSVFLATRPSGPAGSTFSSLGAGGAVDPYDLGLSLTADEERKRRAAQITSSFENSTLDLQYDYAENIRDGRGITAGRAGFTSGTGDLLLLVERYTEMKPGNPLARYIPALQAVNGTDSEAGLEGFADAWAAAAEDPEMRSLQDAVVDELYFDPAMGLAADVGIATPLGQTIMWDTMIQHGKGGENGTLAIIDETRSTVGALKDETAWLNAFLDARLHHLGHAYEGTTENADDSSASRVAALRSIVESGNLALEPPLTWEVYGTTFELPAE